MAFVAEGSQAFLSGNDDVDDDAENNFAALDSMTPNSSVGSRSAFMQQQLPGGGGGDFSGVSESLFDRIRKRTEEQQKQQQQSTKTQPPAAPHPLQQQPPLAFESQQSSSEPSMEGLGLLEREPASGVLPAANAASRNDTTENTYSFAAATSGEDFSFHPLPPRPSPHIPTYGPSRNDPTYYSSQQQHYPTSFQEKATMAIADAGSTMKFILEKGMSGAQSLVTSAQERMGGGGGVATRGGYSNSFLLREDSLEQGDLNNNYNNMMQSPPPPSSSSSQRDVTASAADSGSGQTYSMLSYGKTFCEDFIGFIMQLPNWGKGFLVLTLLVFWLLMRG